MTRSFRGSRWASSGGVLSSRFPSAAWWRRPIRTTRKRAWTTSTMRPGSPHGQCRVITNSTTTQATLITPPCGCGTTCTETETDACIHLRLPELGSVDIRRTASGAGCAARRRNGSSFNYQAGLTELTRAAEDAIIRLAHSLMATEPCSCEATQFMWRRDRQYTGSNGTRERINCSFGLSDGAWYAWRWAQEHKLVRGAVL